MRRPVLLSITTLGVLICLIGGTGLFAALTDTADTGTNEITTEALPGSADLQLAPYVMGVCGTYSDDLATGLFTVNPATLPSAVAQTICVKNLGAQTVDLDISVFELEDVDVACTGDEQEYGDNSCGTGQPGTGELAAVVTFQITPTDCNATPTGPVFGGSLASLTTPLALLPSLGPNGAVTCYEIEAFIGTGFTITQQQLAQSDTVTWRFRFTGTVPQP